MKRQDREGQGNKRHGGDRIFPRDASSAGPRLWNDLPHSVSILGACAQPFWPQECHPEKCSITCQHNPQ